MTSELHPLEPFLPAGARLLMLGSFPPQRVRWSMDFFYPNLQNDMWRIVGLVFFADKSYFLTSDGKRFDKERIECFCREKGLALYDTAEEIIRIEKQCFRQFSSSSARGRFGAVVGSDSGMPGNRDDGTEGYRCNRAPCRLCRAACGRECGVRLCGPYASALSHALFVAGLSETGGVEGGLLPADVRCVRDALIELPVG